MSEVATTTTQTIDVSKYVYQIRKLKDALANATKERDTYKADSDRVSQENRDLKAKGDTSALSKRNQELEGKLRVIEHRKVLDKAALAKGIKPEALEAFYKLSEYEAKGEPVEEEIGAFVDSKVESLAFLVGKAEETPTSTTKAAPGGGKGGKTAIGGFTPPPNNAAEWSDPKWQARNADKLEAYAKEMESKGVVDDSFGRG